MMINDLVITREAGLPSLLIRGPLSHIFFTSSLMLAPLMPDSCSACDLDSASLPRVHQPGGLFANYSYLKLENNLLKEIENISIWGRNGESRIMTSHHMRNAVSQVPKPLPLLVREGPLGFTPYLLSEVDSPYTLLTSAFKSCMGSLMGTQVSICIQAARESGNVNFLASTLGREDLDCVTKVKEKSFKDFGGQR